MKLGRVFLGAAIGCAMLGPSCDPYEGFAGEFMAGSVDPAGFPAPYLGGGDPSQGGGVFAPASGFAGGQDLGYYALPLPAGGGDPLELGGELVPALAYVFDPKPPSPSPGNAECAGPGGYTWDLSVDAYPLDEQGPIFTALPDAPGYSPLVMEVPVTSHGQECQAYKSAEGLLAGDDVAVGGAVQRYLAWAIIDPRAEVLNPDGSLNENGLGPQRWGWFDHYLLAYLDGGYVPVENVSDDPAAPVLRARAQRLFFPLAIPYVEGDAEPVAVPADGPGYGFDVLEAQRGAPGYSPICELWAFDPAEPLEPARDASEIQSASSTGQYIFCLQLQ